MIEGHIVVSYKISLDIWPLPKETVATQLLEQMATGFQPMLRTEPEITKTLYNYWCAKCVFKTEPCPR